ncbi:DMT family transporter [Patescibacteria group bacterium]|nr:DMT family transporter [Patescibacteria group bacterium]
MASLGSGIAIFYSKTSVVEVDPLILTTSRNILATLAFLLILISSGKFRKIRKLGKRNLRLLILTGLVGGALPFYLYFTGLQLIEGQTANVIHKTLFIWTSLLAITFLGERLNPLYLLSYLAIILGNFYFAPLKFSGSKGEIMIFAATILWAVEHIIAKQVLKSVSAEHVGLFRLGIGSTLLLLAVLLTGRGSIMANLSSAQTLIILIGSLMVFTTLYFWYRALKYAPASLATLVYTFSVVVGNALTGAFNKVNFPLTTLYSSLLITAGVIVVILLQQKPLRKQQYLHHG